MTKGTRKTRKVKGGSPTVITNSNIKEFVKKYVFGGEYIGLLPDDLRTAAIGDWDVSQVTDMSNLFNFPNVDGRMHEFNEPIGSWNVSNVTNMDSMFSYAGSFNQDISQWNVSNVTNMKDMFAHARAFDQPIGSWNVSNVTNMEAMFYGAESFDQPIELWNVSNVTNMEDMFLYADSFSQPIESWNLSDATMERMFGNAESLNDYLARVRHVPIPLTPEYLKQLGYSDQAVRFIVEKKMDDEGFMSYVEKIQDKTGIDYLDQIFSSLIIDPVQASDGNIYERNSIIAVLNSNKKSPLTRERLTDELIPAVDRRRQINELINTYIENPEQSAGRGRIRVTRKRKNAGAIKRRGRKSRSNKRKW